MSHVSRNKANEIIAEMSHVMDRITDDEAAYIMVLAWQSLANDRTQKATLETLKTQLRKLDEDTRDTLFGFLSPLVKGDTSLKFFVQEIVGDKWHTLAGYTTAQAAFDCTLSLLPGSKRQPSGYITGNMGRKYRVVDQMGRMAI